MEKNRFLKILCYGTYVVGFQTMVIMDLWGMAFHAMVVIGLIPALLFISTWACCEHLLATYPQMPFPISTYKKGKYEWKKFLQTEVCAIKMQK